MVKWSNLTSTNIKNGELQCIWIFIHHSLHNKSSCEKSVTCTFTITISTTCWFIMVNVCLTISGKVCILSLSCQTTHFNQVQYDDLRWYGTPINIIFMGEGGLTFGTCAQSLLYLCKIKICPNRYKCGFKYIKI